jgi:hypothetical protein
MTMHQSRWAPSTQQSSSRTEEQTSNLELTSRNGWSDPALKLIDELMDVDVDKVTCTLSYEP